MNRDSHKFVVARFAATARTFAPTIAAAPARPRSTGAKALAGALFAVALCASTAAATARAADDGFPPRFARGVNTSGWMWGTGWNNRPYTDADFQLIRSAGYTSIRIPIDFKFLHDPAATAELRTEGLARLIEGLKTARRHDLGVVLDLHQVALEGLKNNNYSAALEDPAFVERYAVFWRALAAATAGVLDPEWLVLQPMNEPVFNDRPEDWPAVQSKVIAAIREVAPTHWIVACGARWQSRAELMKLKPLDDPRIVYDFHFYDPFEFSHQGASWVGEPVKSFAAVPYPSSPARIAPLVEAVTDQQARRRLEQYGRQEWNREKIDAEIAAVAAWAKKHEVPLMCSEFGVYSRVAPVEDRLQWYRDVVAALERHGIAWMNWNYREKYFGVAEYPEPGKPKLRTELIEALGRKP